MVKYLIGVVFIFIMTCVAWVLLGASVYLRTYDKTGFLQDRVEGLWGGVHSQPSMEAFDLSGAQVGKAVPIEKSDIKIKLSLTHRQKGLLWYPTYKSGFSAQYIVKNTSDKDMTIQLRAKFPNKNAIYDDFKFKVNNRDYEGPINLQAGVLWDGLILQSGAELTAEFSYNSQGLKEWFYVFPAELSSIKDFALQMETDFDEIDFPEGTLSPSAKIETPGGWRLEWAYKNLISDLKIGMELPQKLNPGPLVSNVIFYAPVGLFFFLSVFFIITLLKDIKIHPMNYFFICAAFFAFHLLFAYLIDHISVDAAFAVSAMVSLVLVANYLRLFTSWRTAVFFGGIPQTIFLIFFSYSFFFKGATGLTITIVAVITLAFLMQITGRINWTEKLKRRVENTEDRKQV